MVRTPHFHCQGVGSIPGQGTKILQAAEYGKKKKERKKEEKERKEKLREILALPPTQAKKDNRRLL